MSLRIAFALIALTISFFVVLFLFGNYIDVGFSPTPGNSARVNYSIVISDFATWGYEIRFQISRWGAAIVPWLMAGAIFVTSTTVQLLLAYAVYRIVIAIRTRRNGPAGIGQCGK